MLLKKRCKGTSFFCRNQLITLKNFAFFWRIEHGMKTKRAENTYILFSARDKFLISCRLAF